MFGGYWGKRKNYSSRTDSCAATLRATIDESLAAERAKRAASDPREGTSTGVTVPDYFEPILGYRNWDVRGGSLYSPLKYYKWEPRVAPKSRCHKKDEFILSILNYRRSGYTEKQIADIWDNLQHESPHDRCHCGYYAVQQVINTMGHAPITAIGVVAQWGVIQQYTNGWRSQYAYPKEFYLTDYHYTAARRKMNKVGREIEEKYGAFYLGYRRYSTELWHELPTLGS